MYCLETLFLYGNPIVNSCPQLAKIENNQDFLKDTIDSYLETGGSG
jgi:hypothetical protein